MGKEIMVFTVADVAGLLGLSKISIYKAVKHKQIPFIRIGNCIRIPQQQLYEWMNYPSKGIPKTPTGGIKVFRKPKYIPLRQAYSNLLNAVFVGGLNK